MLQRYDYVGWKDTIVSGWGANFYGGNSVDTLQWALIPPVARSTCNDFDYYNGVVTPNQICAGENTPIRDSDFADSSSRHPRPTWGLQIIFFYNISL